LARIEALGPQDSDPNLAFANAWLAPIIRWQDNSRQDSAKR